MRRSRLTFVCLWHRYNLRAALKSECYYSKVRRVAFWNSVSLCDVFLSFAYLLTTPTHSNYAITNSRPAPTSALPLAHALLPQSRHACLRNVPRSTRSSRRGPRTSFGSRSAGCSRMRPLHEFEHLGVRVMEGPEMVVGRRCRHRIHLICGGL